MHIRKPYSALNSETYISLRQQELRSCKRIGYGFYCEELFIVKHKSSYSCENAIYFNLTMDIIKNNCNFNFYFNKTDIIPIMLDAYEQPLPINLSIPDFDRSLLHVPTHLKTFMQDYANNKEIFDLEERHASMTLNYSTKNFFSNNYIVDIFMFASLVISLISTNLIIYLFCKHKQIGTLMTSLILHKIKDVEASSNETNPECKTLAYTGII